MKPVRPFPLNTIAANRREADSTEKSRRTKAVQGLIGFVLMFIVLWWLLSRLTAGE